MIRSVGESLGKSAGVPFYYEDFREGWKRGIEESKRLNLYRQQYCGCIYSEKDRFTSPSVATKRAGQALITVGDSEILLGQESSA